MARLPPRAIFFDVGGTLVRPRVPIPEVMVEELAACGVEIHPRGTGTLARALETETRRRARHGAPFTFPLERSRQHWLGLYRSCLRRACDQGTADRVARAVHARLSSPAGYELYPDALPALGALAGSHRLGIISNWEAWLPELLARLGVAHLFDHVIASGVIGAEKPSALVFAAARDAAGLRPEQIVYVGDSVADDVDGAAKAGMQPVLLDRSGNAPPGLAVPVISSLEQLPSMVANFDENRLSGADALAERFDH